LIIAVRSSNTNATFTSKIDHSSENTIYRWLRRNTLDLFDQDPTITSSNSEMVTLEEGWKERKQAQNSIKAYLTDIPTTVAFIHGPQGSGKIGMVEKMIAKTGRTTLIIDCRELLKATTDSQLVGTLATQTGYWPAFTFFNSIGSLIDLASVGLIGQKSEYYSLKIIINY